MIVKKSLFLIALPIAFLFTTFAGGSAHASSFNAGKIIDDVVFTNSSSMSASQIQAFLNSKVPTCDTNGSMPASDFGRPDLTHAQYAASRGWSGPPYTCLKDYVENGTTAAQLIYNLSQQYQINPQVFIVTLQKEASLVTDYWPLASQYRTATGYGCPDSGPNNSANCSASYYGFTNQLTWTAKMYRAVLNQSPTWYSPYVVGNNYIQWSPTASCGGSNVYIENWSTAALYDYTPYQPNAAALNAGYAMGDGCSAYGNRNFWLYFSDWFGSTYTAAYSAKAVEQSAYPSIMANSAIKVYIKYLNQGSLRWYDDASAPTGVRPIHLAATNPINRISSFSEGWPSGGRPGNVFTRVYKKDGTTLANNQHAVEPGEYAVWEFNLTVPADYPAGTVREAFQPVVEGDSSWSIGGISWLDVTVTNPYKATVVGQSNYSYKTATNSTTSQFLRYRNDGNAYWYDTLTASTNNTKPTVLANTSKSGSPFSSTWPRNDRASSTFSAVYLSDGVTLSPFQHVVRPGEIVLFTFTMTAKDSLEPSLYRETFSPLIEGFTNSPMGGVAWFDINVNPRSGDAKMSTQSPYPTLRAGSSQDISLSYQNNTNAAWYDDTSAPKDILPIHLSTYAPVNRSSAFSYNWFNRARPALSFSQVTEADGFTLAPNQHVANPGQIATFTVNLTAPWSYSGGYREFFAPIVEGSSSWYQSGVSWMDIQVRQN